MHLVWTHLDSPVDGVNETVMEVFKILLTCVKAEQNSFKKTIGLEDGDNVGDNALEQKKSEDNEIDVGQLIVEIKTKAMQMSWQVKGKHELLAALLPHMDIQEVQRLCLSTLCLIMDYP